mgnify:CR=1 FL=1
MAAQRIKEYRPTEDEEYMNERQLQFFKTHLVTWRTELVASIASFSKNLKETTIRNPDPVDQSSTHTDMSLDLQTRLRQQKLIRDIDYALERIADGEYGYCEVSGEEIGLKRLLARPVATMSVDVQEMAERKASGHQRFAAPSLMM